MQSVWGNIWKASTVLDYENMSDYINIFMEYLYICKCIYLYTYIYLYIYRIFIFIEYRIQRTS